MLERFIDINFGHYGSLVSSKKRVFFYYEHFATVKSHGNINTRGCGVEATRFLLLNAKLGASLD